MPALSNPKHERFAQELARGKSAIEAYTTAGFSPNRGNATTLKQNQSIINRVSEIQARTIGVEQKASEKAAERLSIDREWVLERLRQNALSAAESGDFGPSNRALELIGKEIAGMFVDRKHVDIDGELRGYTDAQLIALLADDEGEARASQTSGGALPH
jgi:hypothetical protein